MARGRPGGRAPRVHGGVRGLTAFAVALGIVSCEADSPTGLPGLEPGFAAVPVSVGSVPGLATVVVEVASPTLPEPFVFNLTLVEGSATDTLVVPAGADRTITVRGFDPGNIESHRGSVTVDIVEGLNEPLTIALAPLSGRQPITVVLGGLSVTVIPGAERLEVTDSAQWRAVVTNPAGDTLTVPLAWGSSDPSVARIDSLGMLRTFRAGSARIAATYDGAGVATTLEVEQVARGLSVDTESLTFASLTDTATVRARVLDAAGQAMDSVEVAWSSTASSVVSVGTGGTLTAVGNGAAQVTATSGSVSDTVEVTVRQIPFRFLVDADTLNLPTFDDAKPLPVTLLDARDQPVLDMPSVVTLSDSSVVSVDGAGVARGLGVGSAQVVLSNGNLAASVIVTSRGIEPVSAVGGIYHTCALDTEGKAFCWGRNREGQLGDGTGLDQWLPVAVAGDHVFVALTSGWSHTCGIDERAVAWCWGANESGQLGDGSTAGRMTPGPVSGGVGFRTLSAASGGTNAGSTCGVSEAGTVLCWGANQWGQLGNGSYDSSPLPVAVRVPVELVSVTAGGRHSCGLTSSGEAYCWGGNWAGQLGTGAIGNPYPDPQPGPGGLDFASLALGLSHSCGRSSNGDVHCWGEGTALGDGVGSAVAVPVRFQMSTAATELRARYYYTCALDVAGDVYCTGRNSNGELGSGDFVASATPVRVASPEPFSNLALGEAHGCGQSSGGSINCWGSNRFGELGTGDALMVDGAVSVSDWPVFTELAASSQFSCGLTDTGDVYCWGLLPTPPAEGFVPVRADVSGVTQVVVVGASVCTLDESGQASCWGGNARGQLGDGTGADSSTPSSVLQQVPYTRLAAGGGHVCGLTAGGVAECWGQNDYGQAGDPGLTDLLMPVPVASSVPFVSLSLGTSHSCGIDTNGGVWCWGRNWEGQLGVAQGRGTGDPTPYPALVSGLSAQARVVSGGNSTCTLSGEGDVTCWGNNGSGQFGNGSTGGQLEPSPAFSGVKMASLSLSAGLACGVSTSDAMVCTGRNPFIVPFAPADFWTTPRDMGLADQAGLLVQTIGSVVCAQVSSGSAYCWGYNVRGYFGNGRPILTPQRVAGGISFRSF